MDQLDIAIHNTAHNAKGGLERLAAHMGIGAQVLRNKCNPNTDTHKLSLREAMAMMHTSGDAAILGVMADMLGYSVTQKDCPTTANLMQAVLHAMTEHGDVTRAVDEALADDVITPREEARIRKEISELQTALMELLAAVTAMAKRGAHE